MSLPRVAPIGFTLALLWTFQALAGEIELRVETVLATNTPVVAASAAKEFDGSFNPDLKEQLTRVFPYSSYQLVQRVSRKGQWGKREDFTLPGGRLLQIAPREYTNHRIALQIMLMEGSAPSPFMNAALWLPNNGNVFYGGRRYHDGVLIIRIGAVVKE
jgi:hypothetical protein